MKLIWQTEIKYVLQMRNPFANDYNNIIVHTFVLQLCPFSKSSIEDGELICNKKSNLLDKIFY